MYSNEGGCTVDVWRGRWDVCLAYLGHCSQHRHRFPPRFISLASPAHWKSFEMEEKETLTQGTQELKCHCKHNDSPFVCVILNLTGFPCS